MLYRAPNESIIIFVVILFIRLDCAVVAGRIYSFGAMVRSLSAELGLALSICGHFALNFSSFSSVVVAVHVFVQSF